MLLTGIGPVIAWRRASASGLRRHLLTPAIAGATLLVVLLAIGVRGSWTALALFTLAGFVGAVILQEFVTGVRARRAVAREPIPIAVVSLVKRNRRRYGGYLVHLGVLVLFVGVSASSSFQSVHDARLGPGQSAQVGSYKYTYVKPTAALHAASNGRLERISLGAMMRVSHNGGKPITLNTYKDYFPSQDPSLGFVSRFFDGEATSEVGLKQGTLRDVWAAINPDITQLQKKIDEGDQVFKKAGGQLTPQQSNEFLAVALQGLANGYTKSPPPATFRLLVSPLVTWIWVGRPRDPVRRADRHLAHAARHGPPRQRRLRRARRARGPRPRVVPERPAPAISAAPRSPRLPAPRSRASLRASLPSPPGAASPAISPRA